MSLLASGARAAESPPDLVIDRAAREVRILAEATGIGAADPLEFILVTPASSHAYESLAVSRTAPGALHDALLAIGLVPGRSPDPRALAFWPKGERTRVFVRALGTNTNALTLPLPVEQLLQDVHTKKPTREDGFLFVEAGSAPARDGSTNRVYAPDAYAPHAIVSLYNEPTTVFDVPRIAAQSSVYGQQKLNPATLFTKGTLLEFTFRPERTNGPPRVREGILTVHADARYSLSGIDPLPDTPMTAKALTAAVAELIKNGADPFVRIRFDSALRLDTLHDACKFLSDLENEDGIRVDSPEPDQLFYRAFIPDEENRRRADRVAQPCELRFTATNDTFRATLVHITEAWHDDQQEPELTATEHPLGGPEDLRPVLDALGQTLPVLLVFAPPEITLSDLTPYLTPARPTHAIVHVYVELPSSTSPP